MARICAACRQPVTRDARDHDCPADDETGNPQDDSEAEPLRRRGRRMTVAGMARRGLLPRTPVVTVHVAGSTVTAPNFLDAMQWALRRSGAGGLI